MATDYPRQLTIPERSIYLAAPLLIAVTLGLTWVSPAMARVRLAITIVTLTMAVYTALAY